jgi:hypothetical protein
MNGSQSEKTGGQTPVYTIRVAGRLDAERAAWFDGLSLIHTSAGETVLSGTVRDQSALHGILARVRDLGLTLIAVVREEP